MNQTSDPKPKAIQLTKAEREIIEDIRRVKYGRVVIYTQQGKPFRKEIIIQKSVEPKDGGTAGRYSKPKGGSEVEL